jgi:hypothetical protein
MTQLELFYQFPHGAEMRPRRNNSGNTGKIPMTNMLAIVPDEKRLMKGERLKNVDGRWSGPDDTPVPEKMLVLGNIRAVQRWHEQKVEDCIVQTSTERLPDVDELNGKVPETDWEKGLDGRPKPPWQNVWGFYLCNPRDGAIYTFVNGTVGARIAYDKLNERVEMMRMLRGANVAPIVKLDSRPMKTQFGTKMRPEFTIESWVQLNGAAAPAPAIEHKTAAPAREHKAATPALALKAVSEPTAAEEFDDLIPF